MAGGDYTAHFLAGRLRSLSHARSVQCLELLSEIGTAYSIDEIYGAYADHQAYYARRQAARAILIHLANARRVPLQTMLDRLDITSISDLLLGPVGKRFPGRLRDLMLNGHRITKDDFLALIVDQPARREAAQKVIWGALPGYPR